MAFNHSFQKLVMFSSRPKIPYARGIQKPVSPSVKPSIFDAAPWRTGRSRSVMSPIFSSTALISSSNCSLDSDPDTTVGSFARSRDSLARSEASRSPRLAASSRSSSVMFSFLHSSQRFSNSSAARWFRGIQMITQIACSRDPLSVVMVNPCHVDRGRWSEDTILISLGKANIGT